MMRKPLDFFIIDLIFLGSLILVLYSSIDPLLAFSESHASGGDMISHPWVSKSLKDAWSSGHFWSWNHGWFAGFPFLYFYFYPMYIFSILLESLGLSEAVSFKVMILTAVTSLPVVYYLTGRRWLSPPLSMLLAALGMALFFNEFSSHWGGNFKSLLAGQISYHVGLVAMVGFFSYIIKGETNKKGAIFFYCLSILSHLYSALFSTLIFVVFLLSKIIQERSKMERGKMNYPAASRRGIKSKKKYGIAASWRELNPLCGIKKSMRYLTGPLISLFICAFWWLPFLYYSKNTVAPINNTIVTWQEVMRVLQINNSLYILIYAGAASLIIINLIRKKQTFFNIGLFILTIITTISLMYLKGTPFLHIRLPPVIYVMSLLVFVSGIRNLNLSKPLQWVSIVPLSMLVLQSVIPSHALDQSLPRIVRHGVKDIPLWWHWNISGIESKPRSYLVFEVWDFLKGIEDNEGRVAVEYGNYNSYGSPRIFELTPYFSGKPVMEGLLLESSPNYPSYFYISRHFNSSTWWPGFPVTLPDRDVEKGVEFFARFNVKYFVANTRQTKKEMADLNYPALFENDSFQIFQINDQSRIASVIEGSVPVIISDHPLMETVLNFPESLEKIVEIQREGENEAEDLNRPGPEPNRAAALVSTQKFSAIKNTKIILNQLNRPGPEPNRAAALVSTQKFSAIKNTKIILNQLKSVIIADPQSLIPLEGSWSENGQKYTVFNTGASSSEPKNVLFKISYFPNWRTNTGEPIRLVSPNLMMVRTENPSLSIEYRAGSVEKLALLLSLSALFLLIFKEVRQFLIHRKYHFKCK